MRYLVLLFIAACLLPSLLPAQIGGDGSDGDFAPVADATISTEKNKGIFNFRSIYIPSSVTVTFVGRYPVILHSQRTVRVYGTLDASAPGLSWDPGPGGNAVKLQSSRGRRAMDRWS